MTYYKPYTIGDAEYISVLNLIYKGLTLKQVANKLKLPLLRVKKAFDQKIAEANFNNNTYKPVFVGCKIQPYFYNEMDYGSLELNYKLNDLSSNEMRAYKEYEQKNKAYYDLQ
tara:strand:+ start:225 stop:563 length:339 start_codon:yes stop_codon:yes gene_type:complete